MIVRVARANEAPMFSMNGISKVYRTDRVKTHALRNFSLPVGEGELVAVMGPAAAVDAG